MRKSVVTFTYANVQVSVVIEHQFNCTEDEIVELAQDELTFHHDIDVKHLGDWMPKVTPVE